VAETAALDHWASWILERRFGGDAEAAEAAMKHLAARRERVLAGAEVREGDVVLDVGAGDGLIAFGALPLVGETGKVIFSDISLDLLDVSRRLAEEAGVRERAEFVRAAAEDLEPIADESVDVVTTRAVVIYVTEKQRAFDAFHRVLRPGGRLSMFEPINRFNYPERDEELCGFDVTPVADLKRKVDDAYERLSGGGDATLVDFDERDLIEFADRAGFREIVLEYEASVRHGAGASFDMGHASWDAFLNTAPNPLAPSLAEAIDNALTPEEAERFVAQVRPLYEAREGTNRRADAYLRAVK
jgi:arsenite methyltransferase